MTLSLQYDEINKLIKRRTGHELEIEYVNKDTIHVSYNIQLPIFEKKAIGIDLKVLGFNHTASKSHVRRILKTTAPHALV